MSFYSLSNSEFTRHHHAEVEMVFSGIDCVLHRDKAIYCSSELTTGWRLYEALRRLHLKTADELRKREDEWRRLWDANCQAAIEFAGCVRSGLRDQTMVITPAPFSAPGWSQQEYLGFWEELLRTRIVSAWFNLNWEYSNGCTFEFAVAQDAGLPAYDTDGNTLERKSGIERISRAIEQLEAEGFDTTKLRENLARLCAAG